MKAGDQLSIGQIAKRTGLSVAAIRFYEDRGLVSSRRSTGNQRVFRRADIRRLSFVLIAQRLGFSLADIGEQLASLPAQRTPTRADWTRLAKSFAIEIDARIAALSTLRDTLDGCIGCGCLSLQRCRLYNRDDAASALGEGPRYLLGDQAADALRTTDTCGNGMFQP